MDAAELKELWQSSYRELLRSDTYRVSKAFDHIFTSVAAFLTSRTHVDPKTFVHIQILYMLDNNRLEMLFPNVLSGEGAISRYMSAPSMDTRIHVFLVSLQAQADCFKRVCETMGEEFAFSTKVTEYNPLFMAHMCWVTGREMTTELRVNAFTELRYKPEAVKFFSQAFLDFLKQ